MSLVTVVVTLIVVGVVLWVINSYIPMAASIKKIINVVVVIVAVLWLLNVFGVWKHLRKLHVEQRAVPTVMLAAASMWTPSHS
jgi:hypothetical protein